MDIASIPDVLAWHFAWTPNEHTEFDPATMNREDEVIVEATIEQSQDGHAIGSFRVINPRVGLYNGARKQWAYMSASIWDPTILPAGGVVVVPWFKFYLEAWPAQGDGIFLELSLKAMPSDWLARQEAVLAEARVAPWYDEAFVGSRDPITEPEVNLEARPALVHCNALSHEASLVSVIDAPDELDIGDAWIGDSLGINDGSRDALDAVTVEISTRYRQPISAVFAVSPTGLTYTPSPLWKARIKNGAAIDGAYKLLNANFAFYQEEAPGTGLMIPARSTNGMVDDVGVPGGGAGEAGIARWSFFMNYQVAVSYEIQREETCRITIAWNGQKTNRILGPARSETISLQISMDDASNVKRWRPRRSREANELRSYAGLAYRSTKDREEGFSTFLEELEYNDPDTGTADPYWIRYPLETDIRYQPSFFSTPRGELAIQHGALVAQARLAVSRSSYVTTFDLIKPALGLQVSCAMMMRASQIPIGGGDEFYGKVSKWSLKIQEGGAARFTVDLSAVPGSGIDPEDETTGADPTQEILVSQEGAINGDGEFVQFQGKDWAGVYAPLKTDYPADRPTWWPAGRSWPPNLAEDTLGLYTHGRSLRFSDGSSQIYVQPGQTPLDPIADPYGAIFPADAPAWWPRIASPFAAPSTGNPVTGHFAEEGEFAFSWPPGSPATIIGTSYYHPNSDPFHFHLVPPENDELDGSGGAIPVPGDDDPLDDFFIVPASDQPWDKIAMRQTVIPYVPPAPLDYFALPRVAQADDAPDYEIGQIIPGGIEIRYQAPEQAFILTHRGHPHWGKLLADYGQSYDPFDDNPGQPPALPGDDGSDGRPGFDPEKALELIETEVVLHLKSVQGISSSINFESVGKWNGPKHVDTRGAQS